MAQQSGEPLSSEVRRRFEPQFGRDLSHVRVHTGGAAARAAEGVQARAYTVGDHIVFGDGQYAPATSEGQRLLAHELTHTIQHGRASVAPGSSIEVSRPDAPSEVEADRAASAVLAGASPFLGVQAAPSLLLRQEQPRVIPAASTPWGRTDKAPSTWGWGGLETSNLYQECTVVEMQRPDFLAFYSSLSSKPLRRAPQGAKAALGVTVMTATQAVPPRIEAAAFTDEQGRTRYKLKPTHAEMPVIQSAFTGAGEFVEDKGTYVDQTGGCRTGVYPIRIKLTADGAEKVRQGEQEHCKDFNVAFDLTLGLYASVINNVAAAERVYTTSKQAEDDARRALPLPAERMVASFVEMADKSTQRDRSDWHTPTASRDKRHHASPGDTGCTEYVQIYDAASFPEVGKHASYEVMSTPAASSKTTP